MINQIMYDKLGPILEQHLQWKNFCIDSLNQNEFTDEFLNSTRNTLLKMFQRDKFFLELYLRTITSQTELVPKQH